MPEATFTWEQLIKNLEFLPRDHYEIPAMRRHINSLLSEKGFPNPMPEEQVINFLTHTIHLEEDFLSSVLDGLKIDH